LSLETIVQNIVHIMETQLHGAKLRQPSMRQQ
jgi:hypothetical protein